MTTSEPTEPARPIPMAEAVAKLSRLVLADETIESVLQKIAELAKDCVPGAAEVSVTLVRGDRPVTACYTGPLALDADEMQYHRGFGPCLDAARGGVLFRIDDMRAEERWPDYAAMVVRTGVLSSVSAPLPLQEDVIGALNVYGTKPHAFDEEAVAAIEVFAGHAAVALLNAHAYASSTQLAEQMREAMASRAVIEQAKGVLVAERRCSPEEAFEILVRLSQNSNRKLRDVAAALLEGAQRRR